MSNDKYKKPDRVMAGAGILSVIAGTLMVVQGYNAYRTGSIIPLTGKHGPMSGPEFMIAGGMFSLFGLGLFLNEIYKVFKKGE